MSVAARVFPLYAITFQNTGRRDSPIWDVLFLWQREKSKIAGGNTTAHKAPWFLLLTKVSHLATPDTGEEVYFTYGKVRQTTQQCVKVGKPLIQNKRETIDLEA